VTLAAIAGLVVLSVAWPAPLPPKADLLAIPGRIATDWFYGFWLPLADRSPAVMLATLGVLGALLVAVPWLLRPARATRSAPSIVDPESCEGCQQCFQDCPFDAIQMIPGLHPERHPLRADVLPDLCVSCGLCAGSCASLAIGPPGRTARDQLAAARQLVASSAEPGRHSLLVACRYKSGLPARFAADPATVRFEVDCAGTLHPGTVSYLGRHFADTQVVTCPPQNCLYREGSTLAGARIVGERAPAVAGQIARLPVRVIHDVAATGPRWLAAVVLSVLLLALVALASGWPQGADADHAVLRLGWRLTGQVRERCRDLTAEELAARPVHMRRPRECVSEVLTYDLVATVDGRVVSHKRVKSPGLRADRPLSVEEDLKIVPGEHTVSVTFAPAEPGSGGKTLALEERIRFAPGRVVLLTHEDGRLVAR
jgi:ferredoxin